MLAPNTLLYRIQAQPSTTNATAAPPKTFRGMAFRDELPRRWAAKSLNAPVLLLIRPTPEQFHFDLFQAACRRASGTSERKPAREPRWVPFPVQHLAEARSVIKASFS